MKRYLTLPILVVASLLFLSLLQLILPARSFSAAENRMLQTKPAFAWESLLSGKFTSALEAYVTDQFPFRDSWVGVKSVCEQLLQKKDNNGVFFGKDGNLLQKPDKLDRALLQKNVAAINDFAAESSIPVYFLLAPNAVHILDSKLPPFAAASTDTFAIKPIVTSQLQPPVNFIDVYQKLAAHRQEYIYYRTDHHWTSRGAYYAYQAAADCLGFTALDINDFSLEEASDRFYGTLYSQSGRRFLKPDAIHFFKPKARRAYRVEYVAEGKVRGCLYERKHLQEKDQYSVFLDGNHPLVIISTGVDTERRLLVIKDSFAQCFIPFLANHFADIDLIDLRYYNAGLRDYMAQNSFTEVLLLYNAISFAEERAVLKLTVD